MSSALDVIVVSFNTREDSVRCLSSIFAAPPRNLRDVFVVDNASTDGSAGAVRAACPAARVIALERNVGFGAANNVALRLATAPLVLLLNSDALVARGAIDALADRLTSTGATAAGPRLVDGDGRPEVSFGAMLSPATELAQAIRMRLARRGGAVAKRYTRGLVSRERDVDWVSGACLLVRRDAALAAGLFDERYFLYEEDVDFCAALRAGGGRILFTPAAEIVHARGRSGQAAGGDSAGHYHRSHLAFYEKHRPGWAPLLRVWQRLRSRISPGD